MRYKLPDDKPKDDKPYSKPLAWMAVSSLALGGMAECAKRQVRRNTPPTDERDVSVLDISVIPESTPKRPKYMPKPIHDYIRKSEYRSPCYTVTAQDHATGEELKFLLDSNHMNSVESAASLIRMIERGQNYRFRFHGNDTLYLDDVRPPSAEIQPTLATHSSPADTESRSAVGISDTRFSEKIAEERNTPAASPLITP